MKMYKCENECLCSTCKLILKNCAECKISVDKTKECVTSGIKQCKNYIRESEEEND